MNIDAKAGHSGRARNFEALRSYDREPVSEDYVLIRDVMVPMRDGVRLATDVYLPAKDGRSLSGKAVAPITIELWMTGNRFVEDHRSASTSRAAIFRTSTRTPTQVSRSVITRTPASR